MTVPKNKAEHIYGYHAIEGVLIHDPDRLVGLHVIEGRHSERYQALLQRAVAQGVTVRHWPKQRFESELSPGDVVHQGLIAEVRPILALNESTLQQWLPEIQPPALLLILDGITDPHNLGACLRSAAAFNVQAVIVPKDKTAPLNAVAQKVACGAANLLRWVVVTNLKRTIDLLKQHNIWVYGAAGEATDTIDGVDFTGSIAIALGSEGKGLRRLTRETCDGLFAVPISSKMESLNVSVTTGVVLAEVNRQRRLV